MATPKYVTIDPKGSSILNYRLFGVAKLPEDMANRGNGAKCVASGEGSGGAAEAFLAKAKARAAIAQGVVKSKPNTSMPAPVKAPAGGLKRSHPLPRTPASSSPEPMTPKAAPCPKSNLGSSQKPAAATPGSCTSVASNLGPT